MSASTRSLAARAAAYQRWAKTDNPRAAVAPAVEGRLVKLEQEIDPRGELDPKERRRRALLLRKAKMADLARRSVAARAGKRGRAA